MSEHFRIAIVGAGMAGASLAAELSDTDSVLLLEAEERPGYHATGRSAAFWTESYGGPLIQPLTTASGRFLRDGGFLRNRGALTLARADQEVGLEDFVHRFATAGVQIEWTDRHRAAEMVPGLDKQWAFGAFEPDCSDIDVAALHAHYLKLGKEQGVALHCRSQLVAAERTERGWTIETAAGEQFTCEILVNAAGAWADKVADLCGLPRIGVEPYRRTMVQLAVNPAPADELPLTFDLDGSFYFKPEHGSLWLSPHDETTSEPCDAAPEEMDVAVAIDRLEQAVNWTVDRVEHRWAGLRSFAPDRLPVYGFDPEDKAFFWFAGQGGFGIQTAPAAARLGSQLLRNSGRDAMTMGLTPDLYSPARFR
ncbi:FAD-binding oxidoreductase [Altericroceibacterium spongiae]|uniref:FAD-binding oxidoreductase n=1 Tax=Altericroceibacterium spongiae TaxID=2320269 RepID=A0A420EKK6_9SPHN|nr:FAD-dependent oxidoreductase [Altericroceibacterium spongiae]RKF21126.1 FAD-binding oxidoreductase [Altericroceibacterium spongiae]